MHRHGNFGNHVQLLSIEYNLKKNKYTCVHEWGIFNVLIDALVRIYVSVQKDQILVCIEMRGDTPWFKDWEPDKSECAANI